MASPITESRTALSSSFYGILDFSQSLFQSLNDRFYSYQSVLSENRFLKQKNYILQSQVNATQGLYQENNNLRALLHTTTRMNHRYLIAELASVHIDPMMQHIVIKRGSADGVFMGQAVADAHGIVGQVTQIGKHLSKIMLLSDRRSTIPITITRNGLRGLVSGSTTGSTLEMLYTPESSDVRPGDQLLSSHLGGSYPDGYPVGIVNKVIRTGHQTFSKIFITPASRLQHNQQVLLLWPDPNRASQAIYIPIPMQNTAATAPLASPTNTTVAASAASSATTAVAMPTAAQPPVSTAGTVMTNPTATTGTQPSQAPATMPAANSATKSHNEIKKNKPKAKVNVPPVKAEEDFNEYRDDMEEDSTDNNGSATEWKENI